MQAFSIRAYVYLLIFSAHIFDSPHLGWIATCDIQLCYILPLSVFRFHQPALLAGQLTI